MIKFQVEPYTGTYWESAITFDEHEVFDCTKLIPSIIESQEAQAQFPKYIDYSKVSFEGKDNTIYELRVQIKNVYMHDPGVVIGTRGKIDELFDVKRKLRVYYKYVYDSTIYMDMILDPNGIEDIHIGRYSAEHFFNLVFYGEVD